jgi:hypothetical protein
MSMRVWSLLTVCSLGVWGCGGKQELREFSEKDNVENTTPVEEHHHPEHGPNGGHVAILGDHAYHAELVFDETSRNVTINLLDHDMAKATPVADATLTLKLEGAEPIAFEASPVEGEPAGQTSRFTLAGDKLPEAVKTEDDLHGTLDLTVAGKSNTGSVAHHDDHGHDDHAHEDGHDHK